MVDIPSETSLEKIHFHLARGYQFQITLVRSGVLCSFPLLSARSLIKLEPVKILSMLPSFCKFVCTPVLLYTEGTASLEVHMYSNPVVYRRCCFLESPITFTLTAFLSPLLLRPLDLEGKGLVKTLYLKRRDPKSLTIHIVQLWVSVSIPIYCRRKCL